MSQQEAPDHPNVIGIPPLYAVSSLILALLIDRFVYSLPTELRWLGALLTVLALLGAGYSSRQFRLIGENTRPNTASKAIVDTGLYGYSRNPIYLMVMILQGGLSLLLGTWWGVLTVILSFFMYRNLAVLREEAYLERKLGAEYIAYKQRVRRWL
jgi:protein-S-isoprenylcysteine O-methyltransferase Ste14